jgi:hypothetical protein
MNRRDVLLATAAATVMPGRAFAQLAGRKFRVLAIHSAPIQSGPYHGALKERLATHGFIEGKNLVLDAPLLGGNSVSTSCVRVWPKC